MTPGSARRAPRQSITERDLGSRIVDVLEDYVGLTVMARLHSIIGFRMCSSCQLQIPVVLPNEN